MGLSLAACTEHLSCAFNRKEVLLLPGRLLSPVVWPTPSLEPLAVLVGEGDSAQSIGLLHGGGDDKGFGVISEQ